MKIKLNKEELDKMILESIKNKINSDIEEEFDETGSDSEEFGDGPQPRTKGTFPLSDLAIPGRFYKQSLENLKNKNF
jgi:ribosome biogenesis protein Nip4